MELSVKEFQMMKDGKVADAIESLCTRIAELEAENERLREIMRDAIDDANTINVSAGERLWALTDKTIVKFHEAAMEAESGGEGS